MTVLALTLALANPTSLIYCENMQTHQIAVFDTYCPQGWIFWGYV